MSDSGPEPHPDVRRLQALFKEKNVPPYESLSVADARLALEEVRRLQKPALDVAKVYDMAVPGAAGDIVARIYHPEPGVALPLVVYIHGGGWALGSLEAADRPCRRLCRGGHCVVASLDYRLAPETKFPGGLHDCARAVRWLARHAGEVGGDPETLILMGDSAGGNLAAGVTLYFRATDGPEISSQILLYPCLCPPTGSDFPSYREQAEGPLMSRRTMEWFWGLYLRTPADGEDPLAAPLRADDLSGLPPALIVVAELDPLRDEGLAYAERLYAAGVSVECTTYPGAAHGFWWMDAALGQAQDLDNQLGRYLRRFRPGSGVRGH